MAVDKLVDSTQLDADLESVANAIRIKGGTSAQMAFPAGFVSAVQAIPTGTTPTGTKQITITQNGTTTEDVASYATAEITVNVSGGGGDDLAELCNGTITRLDDDSITSFLISLRGSSFNLQSIFLKNLEQLSVGYCFGNNKVQSVVLPGLKTVTSAGYFFNGASSLQKVDLGLLFATDANGIRNHTFNGASFMSILVLRNPTGVVYLNNINAFNSTPFASGGAGGTLYVPSSLISSYQSNATWSTILGYTNNNIAAIEGSQYENYYADGTPIT